MGQNWAGGDEHAERHGIAHRSPQARRARKCPGVPARMPTRSKNTTKRNQAKHPWAPAHGSPINARLVTLMRPNHRQLI